jgi:hypothetical protein
MNVAVIAVLALLLAGAAFFAMRQQAKTKTPKQPSKSAGQAGQPSKSAGQAGQPSKSAGQAGQPSQSHISNQLHDSFKNAITQADTAYGMLPEDFTDVFTNAWDSEPVLPEPLRPFSANEVDNLVNKFDAARLQLKQSIGSLMAYKISGRLTKSRLKSMWKGLSRTTLAYIKAALKLGGDFETPIWKTLRKAQNYWVPYQVLVFVANSALHKSKFDFKNSLTDIHGKVDEGSSWDSGDFTRKDNYGNVDTCVMHLGDFKKCFARTGVARRDFDYAIHYLRLRKVWMLLMAQTYHLFDAVNNFRGALGLKEWERKSKFPENWFWPSPDSPFQFIKPKKYKYKKWKCRNLYGLDYLFVAQMMANKQTKSVPYGGKCAAGGSWHINKAVKFANNQANKLDKMISHLRMLKP